MQTLLIFRVKPSNFSESRSARVGILECPQLLPGDTFYLEAFEGLGNATAISRHWHGKKLIIQCEVSTFILEHLVSKGKKIVSHVDDYELPDQTWE